MVDQINENCEKIGVSVEQNAALKAAMSKRLNDLRSVADNCLTEIRAVRQLSATLQAAMQKAVELNQNTLKVISAKDPADPQKNKSTWCALCLRRAACCAALCIAASVLAYLLHTAYYDYLHQNHAEDQQTSETADQHNNYTRLPLHAEVVIN
ncbi:MAG: hypothetical protein ACTFAL_11945 [Candidatus Electronema sp. V4]|uniref:hypothetical protein n=1 Tax=Candidatus Electronema sp. V4 TaxID=3454756 RepID=UPI004055471E